MLDYANPLLVLVSVGLVVMVTFLLKRRIHSSNHSSSQSDQEKSVDLKTNVNQVSAPEVDRSFPPHPDEKIVKAREEQKALELQRQLATSALKAVFEAEAQGKLSLNSRDSLIEFYKTQLKALDEQIAERRKITELSDLLVEREELLNSFQQRIAEIDKKLRQHNYEPQPTRSTISVETTLQDMKPESLTTESKEGAVSEEKPLEKAQNRTEERIEAIREEVLKAIERLEKIESEG